MKIRIFGLLLTLLQLYPAPKIFLHATLLAPTRAAGTIIEVGSPLQRSFSAVSRLCNSSLAERRYQKKFSFLFLFPKNPTVSNYTGREKSAVAQQRGLLDLVWKPKREGGSFFPAALAAAASPGAERMQDGAGGKMRKSESFVIKEEEGEEEEGREAALFHQRQLLTQLLNPSTEEEENASSDMTDEEFEKEVKVSVRASPRAVVTALAKWKKENTSSSLKPRLHQKWMEIFERNVLKQLQLHAEEKNKTKNIIHGALRLLLGGAPLSAPSSTAVEEMPSELDAAYSQLTGLPSAFRDLSAEIRQEEKEKITFKSFLRRFGSQTKFFLPLLFVGSLMKRASMTALVAAAGIAGRSICPQTHLSLRSFCLSAGALGAHACLGFLTALCGYKSGGLNHWLSLTGLSTGAIIGQWWLASALYNFSSKRRKEKETEEAAGETSTSLNNFRECEPLSSETPPKQQDTIFDDPELPTAFRDDD